MMPVNRFSSGLPHATSPVRFGAYVPARLILSPNTSTLESEQLGEVLATYLSHRAEGDLNTSGQVLSEEDVYRPQEVTLEDGRIRVNFPWMGEYDTMLELGAPNTGHPAQDVVSREAVKQVLDDLTDAYFSDSDEGSFMGILDDDNPNQPKLKAILTAGHADEAGRLQAEASLSTEQIEERLANLPLNADGPDTVDGLDVSPFKLQVQA